MQRPVFQIKFLEEILERFPKRSEAIDELSRVLGVGPDGIYRRLRGDSILTGEEMALLARIFNISLDELVFDHTDKVIFSYSQFTRPVQRVSDYMEEVYRQAEQIRVLPDTRIYYTAQEIPIFLYYSAPPLFRLKMYVYGSNYWHLPEFEDQPFSFDLIPDEVCRQALEIADVYNGLPSIEIWRLSLLDNTLNQVEFLASSRNFVHPKEGFIILESLRELLEHARELAEQGKKWTMGRDKPARAGAYQLFYNEYISTNDTLLIKSSLGSTLITSFGMPNFLRTHSPVFQEQIKNWFEVIMLKSNSLTVHASKSRNWFFNQLFRKIQLTRERLAVLLEEE